MASFRIESPFPIKGKSEVVSFRDQPALTSRDTENMRGISPLDGRVKGAKRAGFTLWNTGEVDTGGTKVQFLDYVVTDDRLITYSAVADGSIATVWQQDSPDSTDIVAAAVDARGVIYIVYEPTGAATSGWAQISPDNGGVIYSRSIPNVSGSVRAIAVDANYDVYLGVSGAGTAAGARLYRFRAEPDGTYTLAWEKEVLGLTGGTTCYIRALTISNNTLYAAVKEIASGDCDVVTFESYRTSIAPTVKVQFATEVTVNDIAVNSSGEIFTAADDDAGANSQWLTKYDSQGTEIWQIETLNTGQVHEPGAYPTTTGYHPGGIGFGCVVNSEGDIYTVGNHSPDGTNVLGTSAFCKIVDDGANPNMDPAGTYWEQDWVDPTVQIAQTYGRHISVDKFDNVYHHDGFTTASGQKQILAYAKDGSSGVATNIISYISSASNVVNRGTAILLPVDGETPEYQATTPPDRAEYAYVLQIQPSSASTSLAMEKVRLVSVASATGSARNITAVTAQAGSIFTLSAGTGGGVAPAGSNTLAQPALEATPQLIQTASAFNKLFIVDGVNSVYYDPVEDEVLRWGATDAGRLPPRCKLLTVWRGRMMLSGDPDNANAWHASQSWKPFGWEILPKVITQTQAMTSSLTDGPGEVPDIINALIPYNRDFLLFGCDHHLFMMRGDPAAGGQIELVSDVTGTSLGTPWTKDPQGSLYFFGSKGGVYRWVPGAQPERISEMSIDRELFDLDLGTYHIAMEWSHREDGIRIVQIPYGTGGAEAKSYFWERKTGGWHVDSYDDTDHQPTAMMAMDGDLGSDRVILYGCEDGFVRYVDETASDDDGEKIDGRVVYGPYFDPDGHNLCVEMFRVELDRAGSGCRFEWYATESVDDPLTAPTWSGDLSAGQNSWRRGEVRGPYLWLRLVNALAGQHYGIENVDIRVMRSGLVEAS